MKLKPVRIDENPATNTPTIASVAFVFVLDAAVGRVERPPRVEATAGGDRQHDDAADDVAGTSSAD